MKGGKGVKLRIVSPEQSHRPSQQSVDGDDGPGGGALAELFLRNPLSSLSTSKEVELGKSSLTRPFVGQSGRQPHRRSGLLSRRASVHMPDPFLVRAALAFDQPAERECDIVQSDEVQTKGVARESRVVWGIRRADHARPERCERGAIRTGSSFETSSEDDRCCAGEAKSDQGGDEGAALDEATNRAPAAAERGARDARACPAAGRGSVGRCSGEVGRDLVRRRRDAVEPRSDVKDVARGRGVEVDEHEAVCRARTSAASSTIESSAGASPDALRIAAPAVVAVVGTLAEAASSIQAVPARVGSHDGGSTHGRKGRARIMTHVWTTCDLSGVRNPVVAPICAKTRRAKASQ